MKQHWPSDRHTHEALGPGGSAGSVEVPVPLCGGWAYNLEFAKTMAKVNCRSCRSTGAYKILQKED